MPKFRRLALTWKKRFGSALIGALRYGRWTRDPATAKKLEIHAMNNAIYNCEKYGFTSPLLPGSRMYFW
jgi:hypothetical protein